MIQNFVLVQMSAILLKRWIKIMPSPDEIKAFRKKHSLTQTDLAKLLGYKTERTIQFFEAGTVKLRDEVWQLLLRGFND